MTRRQALDDIRAVLADLHGRSSTVAGMVGLSVGRHVAYLAATQLDLRAVATADLMAAMLAAPAGAVRETKALLSGAGGRSHAEREGQERSAQVRRLRELFDS